MTDLDHIRALIDEIGNPAAATRLMNTRLAAAGLDYRLGHTSLHRIYRGEVSPAMAGFIRYVLTKPRESASIGSRVGAQSHTIY